MLQITGVNLYLESIKFSVEQVSTENENVHVSRLLEIVDCTETKISVRLRETVKNRIRCRYNAKYICRCMHVRFSAVFIE